MVLAFVQVHWSPASSGDVWELLSPACSTSILSHAKKNGGPGYFVYGKSWLFKKRDPYISLLFVMILFIYNWVGFHDLIFNQNPFGSAFWRNSRFAISAILPHLQVSPPRKNQSFPPGKIYRSWPRNFFQDSKNWIQVWKLMAF